MLWLVMGSSLSSVMAQPWSGHLFLGSGSIFWKGPKQAQCKNPWSLEEGIFIFHTIYCLKDFIIRIK